MVSPVLVLLAEGYRVARERGLVGPVPRGFDQRCPAIEALPCSTAAVVTCPPAPASPPAPLCPAPAPCA